MADITSVDKVTEKLAKADIESGEEDIEDEEDDEDVVPQAQIVEESTKIDPKAGAKIWYGHEESMKKAAELLEKFGLPVGLLPLQNVIELGYVESTGFLWLKQEKKIEHAFPSIGKQVRYAEEVKSFIEAEKIKKLEGVRSKELFLWVSIVDISVEGDKVHFKSFANISKTFPVEAFAA
ncbi:hypothetical protein R1flu_020748 [Riccia fluitans]|uniref:Uncharacterized protein n=1 Tax=Riccia fluitans TaxID=41844 RepID=A0ABD1ZMD4_9MARC